ncbi:protein kinase superfamily protein [Striga asiatica]|uniref:Protein kinase superfamily protein n=1 Tax=Striga asiatica TaxID=4170 RepID=A0A5A7R6A7_STRAF|nr:protein kinase superfamily protein [Striga asiatica]
MRGLARSSHLFAVILLLCMHVSSQSVPGYYKNSMFAVRKADELLPYTSPTAAPQPFLPLLAPSPLTPFTNSTVPRLSGHCPLNFTALSNMMTVTSTNCMAAFAPLLANVVCCPQVDATLAILMGQSSKKTGSLALNGSTAAHCLSDFERALAGQGANEDLSRICSVRASNLTQGSCPVADVAEFEGTVDSSSLLAACGKIDSVNECCEQVCQNAVLDASRKLAQKAYTLLKVDGGSHALADLSTRVSDCKSIVLRWLGSKLEVNGAKEVLRGLSNCRINKVCPLNFPSIRHVIEGCDPGRNNQSACCSSVDSYVTHLQRQSFVTNLQALNCAASLGVKLRRANITENVYTQCRISLKDFSLQGQYGLFAFYEYFQESGCLLPSLPSDVVFDKSAGVSFLCDLNDNIPAPWPATTQLPSSSCNKSVKIPALPAAASGQSYCCSY